MDQFKLYSEFGVNPEIYELSHNLLGQQTEIFSRIEQIASNRQLRVLHAFQKQNLCETDLRGSTGYGYNDSGRDKLEAALAEAFSCEAAFLRWQFSSGTQVLYQMLRALLKAGDELLVVTGELYDSLKPAAKSLPELGIKVRYVDLDQESGGFDYPQIKDRINSKTRAVYVQKSRGYSLRPALRTAEINQLKAYLLDQGFAGPLLVDNCYGEFVEEDEPAADLIAGSLIKNPGGGIAPTGGYIAGRADLVELVAESVTAPGIGREIGPSLGVLRELGLGLYLAPQIVAEALKTAVHLAGLFQSMGYAVEPLPDAWRGDIVQIIQLGQADKLIAFAEAIQRAAPIDHHFAPIPAPMPGYDCDIIMASGSFTQGSSIELSADGPMREPFAAFFQGSFSFALGRLAAMLAASAVGLNSRSEQLEQDR